MSRTAAPIFTLTVAATALTEANRFVTSNGAYATAAQRVLGVARTAPSAIGDMVPVDVLGTAVVEANGAIAADAQLEVAANGRVITRSAGVAVARMAPGAVATAAGDFVEVLLIPN